MNWVITTTLPPVSRQHSWPNNKSNAGSGCIQGMDPKELGKAISECSQQYV